MSEVAGPPQAFGPGGPPKAFGPPGGGAASAPSASGEAKSSPSTGAKSAGAGGASSSKSSTTGSSTSGGSAGAKPSSASASGSTSAKTTASSGTAAKAATADVKLPVAAGTIVRIAGLKAQPTLNGELGQVLHATDSSAERLVVRTRQGDKSLKPANLQVGRSVLPKGTTTAWIVITVLSVIVVTDAFRSGGRSALSAAAAPAISALWLAVTCLLSIYLNWPGREPGTWLPSVSEMSTNSPSREFYRLGFLSASGLFAVTVWLYGQIVVVQLADAPPPTMPLVAGVNTTLLNSSVNETMLMNGSNATIMAEGSTGTSAVESSGAVEDGLEASAEVEDASAQDAEEVLNETAVLEDTANESVPPNTTNITVNQSLSLASAPERSIKWGYVTAIGLAIQGIFVYDGRLSWRSWLNFAGFAAFGVGLFQHCTLTGLIMSSVRGKPLLEASTILAKVVKARRWITDYVPLLLLAAPLSSQIFNSSKMRYNHQQPSFRNVIKDSGMLTSARVMQWIAVMVFVIFYSSFAFDLWVAAQLPA